MSNVCYPFKAKGMMKSFSNLGIGYGYRELLQNAVIKKDLCVSGEERTVSN